MSGSGRANADFTLIGLLASGYTVVSAAQQAGVAERTVFRRLQDPAFRKQVKAQQKQAVERALAMLDAGAASAVATLFKLLDARTETARLGAARSILELGGRLRESTELEERIAALEDASGASIFRRIG